MINGALDFVFLKFLTLRGIFTCSYRVPFEGTDARVLRQSFAVRDDPNRSDLKSGTFGGPGILRQFPGTSNCPIRAEPRVAYLELGYIQDSCGAYPRERPQFSCLKSPGQIVTSASGVRFAPNLFFSGGV